MAGLQSSFTQWFNRRHGRVGHFFQGRYKAFLVQQHRYFAALLRYIHMNPVRARIVERPDDYRWSSDRSFRASAGARDPRSTIAMRRSLSSVLRGAPRRAPTSR